MSCPVGYDLGGRALQKPELERRCRRVGRNAGGAVAAPVIEKKGGFNQMRLVPARPERSRQGVQLTASNRVPHLNTFEQPG